MPELYRALAFVPASENSHPSGTKLEVPELTSVLKSCVYAEPSVVKLIVPAAKADCMGAAININARIVTTENILNELFSI